MSLLFILIHGKVSSCSSLMFNLMLEFFTPMKPLVVISLMFDLE